MVRSDGRANIDLKAFNNETYLKLSGVRLQPVLDTLKILKENGVWLEITNLVIPHGQIILTRSGICANG